MQTHIKEEYPISVKFIPGKDGVGKSRLAAEFADHMEIHHDWSAGFVDLKKPKSFNLKRSGTLLIIDYPEMCRTLNKVPDRELQDPLEEEGTL